MSVTADPETAEDVSESSATASDMWAPQVCWQTHAIWRGTATFSDATDAFAAAGEVLRRLAPTTTPALPGSWPVAALETLDDIDGLSGVVAAGTIHLLPFDRREYRHENLTPLQRASQVILEMSVDAVQVPGYEAVVEAETGGGTVLLWRKPPAGRSGPVSRRDYAVTEAWMALRDRLRPHATRCLGTDEWDPAILALDSDRSRITKIVGANPAPTQRDAWRTAAEIFATARPKARLAALPEPVITGADTATPTDS